MLQGKMLSVSILHADSVSTFNEIVALFGHLVEVVFWKKVQEIANDNYRRRLMLNANKIELEVEESNKV